MAPLTKAQTRKKIRNAVVAEAVEHGFGSVSISRIVTRAQISAGSIYTHFENKETMLRQIFMEIKTEFHEILMSTSHISDSAEMIRKMWFDTFDFVNEQPLDFLFLEYGNSAQILTEEQQQQTHDMGEEVYALLQQGIDDGTLLKMDTTIIGLLLISPAMQLAKRMAISGESMPKSALEQIYTRVWCSVSA